jgi:hypothetical protein
VNVILTQSMPVHPLKSEQKLGEHAPLLEAREGTAPWRQWGPYLIERRWGTLSVEQGQDPESAQPGSAESSAICSLPGCNRTFSDPESTLQQGNTQKLTQSLAALFARLHPGPWRLLLSIDPKL